VLCAQIRSLDLKACGCKRVESVPEHIMDEVMGCLQDLLD